MGYVPEQEDVHIPVPYPQLEVEEVVVEVPEVTVDVEEITVPIEIPEVTYNEVPVPFTESVVNPVYQDFEYDVFQGEPYPVQILHQSLQEIPDAVVTEQDVIVEYPYSVPEIQEVLIDYPVTYEVERIELVPAKAHYVEVPVTHEETVIVEDLVPMLVEDVDVETVIVESPPIVHVEEVVVPHIIHDPVPVHHPV